MTAGMAPGSLSVYRRDGAAMGVYRDHERTVTTGSTGACRAPPDQRNSIGLVRHIDLPPNPGQTLGSGMVFITPVFPD